MTRTTEEFTAEILRRADVEEKRRKQKRERLKNALLAFAVRLTQRRRRRNDTE